MTDQDGRFRINRVAETTGVPEATLRAWERRYQVPKPSRTASGYRLYSQRDVAQVRRMRELCEAGISPADAAREILLAGAPAKGAARRRPASDAERAGQAESLRLMEVVSPEHTNSAGVLALSRAVGFMERAATVAATRDARSSAIVVSCGSVELLIPVAAGQLLEAQARVVSTRDGSISVDVELAVESVPSGEREHVARTTFLLVTLEGAPTAP